MLNRLWKNAQTSIIAGFAMCIIAPPVSAETITAPTQAMLDDLSLPPDILEGLEEELAVPQEWIDEAKTEGAVKVRLPMEEAHFAKIATLFNARYPDIELEYFRGVGAQRAVQPLLSFRRGSYIADVISSFETLEEDFRDADALVEISELLPAYNSIRSEFHSEHGIATAWRLMHYCIGYSTDTVDPQELPETWEELVENPRWRGGNVGMARNYNVWLAQLWGLKGDEWGMEYMGKIFSDLDPQYRKESLYTLPKLVGLGEFEISVPSGDAQVAVAQEDGVPVGYHCPEPVPVYMAWIGILKDNPHLNSSLVFVNWLLSKEGQLSVWWADNLVPSHKDLVREEFMSFPEAVLDKETAPMSPKVLAVMPKIADIWSERWISAGGPER